MKIQNKSNTTLVFHNFNGITDLRLEPEQWSPDFALSATKAITIINNIRNLNILILSADEVKIFSELDSRFEGIYYMTSMPDEFYHEVMNNLYLQNPELFINTYNEIIS